MRRAVLVCALVAASESLVGMAPLHAVPVQRRSDVRDWPVLRRDAPALAVTAGIVGAGTLLLMNGDDLLKERVGDWAQWGLPLAGAGSGLLHGRGSMRWVPTLGTAATVGVVQLGKYVVRKQRPRGGGGAFPSGHTAASFAGAGWLWAHHGPSVGVPAVALAAVTGGTRVGTGAHDLDDVVAGAGLGCLTTWLAQDYAADFRATRKARPLSVTFSFGLLEQEGNEVRIPDVGGTHIDLASFDGWAGRFPSARVRARWRALPGHELFGSIDPIELRGHRPATESVRFDDVVFAASDHLHARWVASRYMLGWRTCVARWRNVRAWAGLAACIQNSRVQIRSQTQAKTVGTPRWIVTPSLRSSWGLTRDLEIGVSLDGVPGWRYTGFEAEAGVTWHVHPRWSVGLSYRLMERMLLHGSANEVTTHAAFLNLTRHF